MFFDLHDVMNVILMPPHSTTEPLSSKTAGTVNVEVKLAASSLLGWGTTRVRFTVMFFSRWRGGFPSSLGRNTTDVLPKAEMYGKNSQERVAESVTSHVNVTTSPGQAACLPSSITLEVSVASKLEKTI